MRCAHLVHRWGVDEPVDRAGQGRFVEVYPAGALVRWGLEATGYKGRNREPLGKLVSQLRSKLPALHLDAEGWRACATSHDAYDAVVCALVARAALLVDPALLGCAAAKLRRRAVGES